jgi:O-succinylbenzoate synthase
MRIDAVELRLVRVPLKEPFRTSFGTDLEKEAILVRAETPDGDGWGECVAGPDPGYSEEFNEAAWAALRRFLVPLLLAAGEFDPARVPGILSPVRGNPMAKASLEAAILDAASKGRSESLAEFLGGTRDAVEVGVSIGIQDSVDRLVEVVAGYAAEGYARIKLKIEPGFDLEPVRAVREAFPEAAMSVDANGAYEYPRDAGSIRALEEFGLVMIEQPLGPGDLAGHAALQREIETPVCLDESIRSEDDARFAMDMGACRIVNIKPGRVGGLLQAVRIHDLARDRGVPVWCGGMLETGIGRAANLALASLPGFTLPADISASGRYFDRDLTKPVVLGRGGTIEVPSGPGIGAEPLADRLEEATVDIQRFPG